MTCPRCGARVGEWQIHEEDECDRRLAELVPPDADADDVLAGLLFPKETRARRGQGGSGERR